MIDPKTVPMFRLGDGGSIPCIGMGTFGSDRVSPDEVAGAVAGGIRAGYRLFDCAACYGNEEQIGKVSCAMGMGGIVACINRSAIEQVIGLQLDVFREVIPQAGFHALATRFFTAVDDTGQRLNPWREDAVGCPSARSH